MLKQVMEIYELLDSPRVTGEDVANLLRSRGLTDISVKTIKGERGQTDFIKILNKFGAYPDPCIHTLIGHVKAQII